MLIALILTPLLLLPGPAREVVSLNVIAAAIAVGFGSGIIVAVVLRDSAIPPVDDARATIVALVGAGIGTVVLWLMLPVQHISTFIHFAIGFMWGVPVASIAHYRS